MTVRTRLVVVGAILPALVLVAAVLIAGALFRRDQLADLDRRLLAQAAVESVGLFDGDGGTPHVHLPSSPLAAEVKDFAPEPALYDSTGALAVRVPDPRAVPEHVPLRGPFAVVRLGQQTLASGVRRTLELPVHAPSGLAYTLWLGASMAPLEATMSRFYGATLSAVGGLALVLLTLQLAVARRLARRIEGLIAFLPRLRDGATALPPDDTGDEIARLRDMLAEVAVRLAAARVEQERLLAAAAHELRTPLTVLRTEVDLALRRERSADQLRAALVAVRADVDRLGALATALLDLQAVRHLGFDRADGDLAALVREACAGMRAVAEVRQIALHVHDSPAIAARFDEQAVRQAVDNLLGNALAHAPAGSTVEVTVERVKGAARIAVADRGPGVPAGEDTRIFEPFQRAAPGRGAGLGLAIVSEVAARHGGRAWLDRTHTPGARFVLEIAG